MTATHTQMGPLIAVEDRNFGKVAILPESDTYRSPSCIVDVGFDEPFESRQRAYIDLFQDAPAAKLALELICAGVAEFQRTAHSLRFFVEFDGGDYSQTVLCEPGFTYTDLINKIGWSRCREALAAARGSV